MPQKKFTKPKKFDRNLIIIGAGAAGLVTAYIAAAVKAKVTLIEQEKMGGDCLNTGCVPSKALLRSAKFLAQARRAKEFGFNHADVDFDFATVMQRVQRIINTVAPHDSIERYTELGVECITGRATITSPWTVEINGKTLTTRSIVIATGAYPTVPEITNIADSGYYTSDTIWNMRSLPKRLLVIGGGPIGTELTQCFARFGSQVTQIEMSPRLLIREDSEISSMIMQRLQAEKVSILTECKAKEFSEQHGQKTLLCDHQGKDIRIPFDDLLIAVGRTANTTGYGLEELDIPLAATKTIQVNGSLQTAYSNIFACGDVAGPFQFTHTAAHQAWYAAVNALFGNFTKVDYSIIPWATFTDPEVARVGLNETQAKENNIPYELTTYKMADLDRAIVDEEAHGILKVLTKPGKDKILGVTIVGEHAGDIIAEYVSAMRNNIGINKILSTIHIYPTLAEANKHLAGNWKKAHTPKKLLQWIEKYHNWKRH